MPQPTTLAYVADLVIRRVIADLDATDLELAEALENAYPFDDAPEARRIWMDALQRNAVMGSGYWVRASVPKPTDCVPGHESTTHESSTKDLSFSRRLG